MSQPDAPGWRPIDTAPRDGTQVLVSCPHGCYVAWWNAPDNWEGAKHFHSDHLPETWLVTDNKNGPYLLRGASPTHWMAIPEHPDLR